MIFVPTLSQEFNRGSEAGVHESLHTVWEAGDSCLVGAFHGSCCQIRG
jgi:hypothetical protein